MESIKTEGKLDYYTKLESYAAQFRFLLDIIREQQWTLSPSLDRAIGAKSAAAMRTMVEQLAAIDALNETAGEPNRHPLTTKEGQACVAEYFKTLMGLNILH